MKAVVCLLLIAVGCAAALTQAEYEREFVTYVSQFNKAYTADAFFYRFGVFKKALDLINKHNSEDHMWKMGINQFTDLTAEEFAAYVHALPKERPAMAAEEFVPSSVDPPSEVDWVKAGAVTPVKDQGQCGSCWAFSTTGTIEGWNFLKNGKLVSLSEQQLVDCSKDVCYGCQGGWPYKALEYVQKNGICSEADYKYTARDGQCKDSTCTPVIQPGAIVNYLNISNEAAMLPALALGPVSVLVEADRAAFQYYHSGILNDASCGTQIDHAITATGYGTENGVAYWNIKNSWGASWGAKGYIRFIRDKNQCGISGGAIMPKL